METTADPAAEIASRMVTDMARKVWAQVAHRGERQDLIGAWRLDLEPSDTLINRVLAILRDRCRSWGPAWSAPGPRRRPPVHDLRDIGQAAPSSLPPARGASPYPGMIGVKLHLEASGVDQTNEKEERALRRTRRRPDDRALAPRSRIGIRPADLVCQREHPAP